MTSPRTRRLARLLWIPLLIPLLGQDLQRAELSMRDGAYRKAAMTYRSVLEEHPNAKKARIGLARAMAGQGKCPLALESFQTLREDNVWTAPAAIAEGGCRARTGDYAAAAAAFEEAAMLQPGKSDAWYELGRLALERADLEALAGVYQVLEDHPDGEGALSLLAVWVALETGSPELDWRLRDMWSGGEVTAARFLEDRLLRGRRCLDLDDVICAKRFFRGGTRTQFGHLELTVWLAETIRREGLPVTAEEVLHRRGITRGDPPMYQSVQVRILTDQGRLDEAAQLLGEHPIPEDAHAMASAWYLARARGDRAAMETLARRWRATDLNPDRSLEQLIPYEE